MNARLKLRKQETMAKKGGSSGAGVLVVLIIAPFVFLFKSAQENPLPTGLLLSLFVGLMLVGYIIERQRRKREDQTLDSIVERATREHVRTLRIQLNQLKVTDAYGNTDATKANQHIFYFINSFIFRDLKSMGFDPSIYATDPNKLLQIHHQITNILIEHIKENPGHSLDDVRTGIEYEYFCMHILEDNGWLVITTPVTGDQGADLIAANDGNRVVVQCKFYSKPVGNKAVQEAYAAKGFQQADYAAVVSNAAFTPSARQLASTNGVFLLHHDDLSKLKEILSSPTNI
jgi:restriction system protein